MKMCGLFVILCEFLVGHVGPKFVTAVCMAKFAQTSSGLFRIQYLHFIVAGDEKIYEQIMQVYIYICP